MTTRRTKGDGGLFQRADGLWIGVVELSSDDGKRRRKRVAARDRNEAIRKLKKLRADVDAGRIAVTASTTVEKWLDRWLHEIHRRKLKPTTYRSYEGIIRSHINPHIGARRLSQLTPEHVRRMHDAIESSSSAQKAHIVLQRALDDAEKEGMITRNVAKVVDKPRHITAVRDPLTVEQAKQLLASVHDLQDPYASRWVAALFLGARQGELLGLQWDRVNLTEGYADLSWQLQYVAQAHGCGNRHSDGSWPCDRQRVGYCPQRRWDLPRGFDHKVLHCSLLLTRPKTAQGTRIVPLPVPLWAALEQLDRGDHNPHNLVWHQMKGRSTGAPIHPRGDYDNWQKALELAGLPAAPLHVARHTTATLLLQAGVPEEIRMAILGHAGALVTRAYAHADQALKRQALDGALSALMPPRS